MDEQSCDINDVTKAAADLVALGCTVGSTHLHDGVTQLQFSSIVSSYTNEIIKDVNDGLISAWEGVKEIKEEYADLSSRAFFYAQNGIVVVAGAVQIEVGVTITGASYGLGAPIGTAFIAHGANNIYEGGMNIYNGPDSPPTQGPTRRTYQYLLRDDYNGNMAYGSVDLILSAGGMIRPLRKTNSIQLFRRDPLNYEPAYQHTGKLALLLEALADSITINSITSEENSETENERHHK
ncbi:hypothetical protein GCM10009504_05620 [Pseudomonas laurentiana]|uniref:DUF4225 domain-containing protein n=1 Tax=Pseudomonas laurentiana TaxID=2364649 RepID=UPI0016737ED6|nr:DUF4225 domain-containing protein [Pseudomonas laurentiana]GGU51769.1 hypothetical protein GCM10009504_05620 [Pseudomonas laurentiana]